MYLEVVGNGTHFPWKGEVLQIAPFGCSVPLARLLTGPARENNLMKTYMIHWPESSSAIGSDFYTEYFTNLICSANHPW